MNIKEIIKKSNLTIEENNILFDVPMKDYTSFKVGGVADCLVKADNVEAIQEILKIVNKYNLDLNVIGNGSNLLVLDGGIRGITLLIKMDKIKIDEDYQVDVESGVKIGKLANILAQKEISGFEEISGIPGTIGGAVIMNAGAHGKEMKDIVKNVTCIDYNGNIKNFSNSDMNFAYRESILKNNKYIVTSVKLSLEKGNIDEIKEKMNQYRTYRKEHQPLEYPSAGSTFKRGKDFITAKLIDESGLKGYQIGGAQVSEKHAGFIINKGNATAKDILDLIEYVKKTVYEKFNKKIELEIQIMGDSQ